MKSFLSTERQAQLVQTLKKCDPVHATPEVIELFTDIPDDMDRVDIIMTSHVLAVAKCHKDGQPEAAQVGLICLQVIMNEALARGLSETDFPMSLSAIEWDLAENHNISIQ
jgi:hypothetical protein